MQKITALIRHMHLLMLNTAQALPNGNYYWRVLAKDAADNLSAGAVRPLTTAAP